MGKAGALGGIIALMALALIFIIIYQFGFLSTASSDVGVNLSGTSYENAYNYSGNTSRAAFATYSMLPILLGGLAVVSAGMFLFVMIGRANR